MSYDKRFLSKDVAIQYDEMYRHATTYDAIIWDLEKSILDYVIEKYVPNSHNLTYLDFACGTGRILSYLEKRFQRAFGIDVSPYMASLAQQKTTYAEIIVGDIIEEPSLIPGPFDVITAFRFFLNAEDTLRVRVLMALKKRMHVGSILILNNHGSGWSLRSLSIRLQRKLGKNGVCEILRRQFENMLEQCGFSILERIGVAILTPRICKMLGPRLTQLIEQAGYRTKISRWLGSNQIYVVRVRNESRVSRGEGRS